MLNPVRWVMNNKTNVKLRIFYFSLEMSKEQKLRQAICNYLYLETNGKKRIDPKKLRSVKSPIEEDILNEVTGFKEYFDKFEESITFIDDIKNPYGIYKFMRGYAEANGTIHKKLKTFTNNKTGEEFTQEIHDYYEPHDPDEYVIMIVDHAALLHPERGESLHQAITKLSSDYFVSLRNKYNFIPVLIQQQTASQESIENMRANRLKPTLDGLGDNKLTQRDADVVLGLFSPYRHRIKKYPEKDGYDVLFFKDNIRFLEVLASREGGGNSICPLYFDGAVNYFKELPRPDDEMGINKMKNFLKNARANY